MRFILLLLAFGYQIVALPLYVFEGVGPDFVLLVLVYLALFQRRGATVWLALAAGIGCDLFSIEPWGARAVGYVLACWVVASLVHIGVGERYVGRLFLVALASSTFGAVLLAFLWGESGTQNLPSSPRAGAFVLYNVVLAAPLFVFFDGLGSGRNTRPQREFFPRRRSSVNYASRPASPASLAEGR